jgi:hypothetical protein
LKESDSEFKKSLYNIKTADLGKYNCPEVLHKDSNQPESSLSPKEGLDVRYEDVASEDEGAAQQTHELTVNVKFITDTPELMTPDMETCSFKQGQCVNIAKTFAEFLEKRGFCTIERA